MRWPAYLVLAASVSLCCIFCETVSAAGVEDHSTPAEDHSIPAGVLHDFPSLGRVSLEHMLHGHSGIGPQAIKTDHFTLLGHDDLGGEDTNGDIWVHGNFAYVGTWSSPCNGNGLKIVDVSDLRAPRMIGRLGARDGTSAEDVVVRRVKTAHFTGDLLATGIQRCRFPDASLDQQSFGVEFWDVSNPYHPRKLGELGVSQGRGGVHELDLIQRGDRVYALLATPWDEWFDPRAGGDFRIVDATDPAHPIQVGQWGARANGLSPGPYFGSGSFGSSFGHSARASEDGMRVYVSYWDLGVITLDISDPTNPRFLSRTRFAPDDDGDGHSVFVHESKHGTLIFQNDEDFDPVSPTYIRYGANGRGLGTWSPSGPPVWLLPGHELTAPVVAAANDGCSGADYPATVAGKIVAVRTPFPFFDAGGLFPSCTQARQDSVAAAAGAIAVVHDFLANATSPQPFTAAEPPLSIPVLFTDHATAQGMLAAGSATLRGQIPSWGFLRIFEASTGTQVGHFDDAPHVHELPPPPGLWSIHNTEIVDDRAYISWYSNGIVALDVKHLDKKSPRSLERIAQFVPPVVYPGVPPLIWGVAVRAKEVGGKGRGHEGKIKDPVVFASDIASGLWIIEHDAGKPAANKGGRKNTAAPAHEGVAELATVEPVDAFELGSVAPNPAFGTATIEYALPRSSWMRLSVLDVQGRTMATLGQGVHPAGRHRVTWSGRNDVHEVPAGIYFVRFETPEGDFTKRVIRMR